ncbi:response regulator [Mycolicibacterium fluoranthenivorans]|jgi:DNA-binding NarL/FixJ family response regulator|uniref:Two component transcriptional regulator, LuxR family n=1 Tax=Mycolicibacterium fluoranthenivorans TaxID=258505 RepID=A0A1G4WA72_9MYCO|nr:response regulator transcription factor [Mycolicibacterium fluoranthenivorans]SCX19280.1 two component transcriptional regulator, LuxR family [Mycolicibacterium fluoranthenivorans]
MNDLDTPFLRVVIADDHPLVRSGLRTILAAANGIEVIGEASTGAEAISVAKALIPDVIVMDLQMPETDGIEATRQIVASNPSIAVLVLTMFEDDTSVFSAMRAGALGYLLKGAEQEEIVRAIQAAAHGEAIFGPAIAHRLIDFFTHPKEPTTQAFPELTDREREVLELIAAGQSNGAISRSLFISPKTVANHVSNIFAKLQVADRSEAIVRARQAGLGERG